MPNNATFFCSTTGSNLCYSYVSTAAAYAAARTQCQARLGDLVWFTTAAEQLEVEQYLTSTGTLGATSNYWWAAACGAGRRCSGMPRPHHLQAQVAGAGVLTRMLHLPAPCCRMGLVRSSTNLDWYLIDGTSANDGVPSATDPYANW